MVGATLGYLPAPTPPTASVQSLSVYGRGLDARLLSGLRGGCVWCLDLSCLAEHPVCSADGVHWVCLHMPGPESLLLGVRRGERIPGARGARLGGWVRILRLWLPGPSPPPRGVGGRGPRLAAARAHAGLRTRRVRVRARAPRLQPLARSRLRCHSRFLGLPSPPPGRRLCPRGPRRSPGAGGRARGGCLGP